MTFAVVGEVSYDRDDAMRRAWIVYGYTLDASNRDCYITRVLPTVRQQLLRFLSLYGSGDLSITRDNLDRQHGHELTRPGHLLAQASIHREGC